MRQMLVDLLFGHVEVLKVQYKGFRNKLLEEDGGVVKLTRAYSRLSAGLDAKDLLERSLANNTVVLIILNAALSILHLIVLVVIRSNHLSGWLFFIVVDVLLVVSYYLFLNVRSRSN